MGQYLTINQAAAAGPLAEFRIRQMVKQGNCPGFYAGSRFYVNYPALLEMLDAACKAGVGEAKKHL